MHVAELWRYPVKSMAGERLVRAELRVSGIVGDRVVHVVRPGGRVVTARTRPRLLGHRAVFGPDGEPLVDGRSWMSEEVAREVERAAGPGTLLLRHDGVERFDVLPLLVATDGAIRAFGYDHRRLRPNVVVAGVDGLAEREWPGRRLRIGAAVVAVASLRQRCIMTTFDPDTLEQDVDILNTIRREFDGRLALDCSVVEEGTIGSGDLVELV